MEIKAANPDSLLFYRMGDFYELFFGDAEEASRALGIVLTKRGKHLGQDIPMCGVPVHAADDYLQKLIALGFRVAVCEQIEDPAEAKKRGGKSVVRRDVVRLVTPGTITEEKLLAPSESSFLMALGRVKGEQRRTPTRWRGRRCRPACFRVAETNADRLLSDIFRVDPEGVDRRRAGVPRCGAEGRLRRARPRRQPAAGGAVRFRPRRRDASRASTASRRRTASARFQPRRAVGDLGVVAYVEKTQKAERPPLDFPEREENGSTLFIDPATRANLELMKTLSGSRDGSLFRAIDRTVTGARRAACWPTG